MNELEKAIKVHKAKIINLEFGFECGNFAPDDMKNKQQLERHKLILSALEKQVPKKVINIKTFDYIYTGNCPNCESIVNQMTNDKHCDNCGQALDWSTESNAQ